MIHTSPSTRPPPGSAQRSGGAAVDSWALRPLLRRVRPRPGRCGTLSTLVVDSDGVSAIVSLVSAFVASLFYILPYRSRTAPRWITEWGFAATPLYVAAYLLAMYRVVGINSSEVNRAYPWPCRRWCSRSG